MRQWIRSVVTGIKNILHYLPVIWEDRDWDFMYIEYLMLVKYRRMYQRFTENHHVIINDKGLKSMRICILILERRKDDWYYRDIYKGDYKNGDPRLYSLKAIEEIEQRDWRIFTSIINKYHHYWWD